MGIKFEGQVLKFGTVDKCNRKFAPDCKITFPEKIPVAYNFDMDEIIGHADISKVEDGLKGVVSLFDTNILPGNEYFVGGYYTRIKTHVEDLPRIGTWHTPLKTQEGNMAQKRIRMVQRDILNDRLRLLYDDGTQGVLEYGEAVSRSKAPAIIKPNDFVGLTLKQAKLKLGIKN